MHYGLVDTALGTMGLGWTESGIARLGLPAARRGAVGAWMARHGSEAPVPETYRPLVDAIITYAQGGAVDFSDVPLDLAGIPPFHLRVYADIRRLAWGTVTTYGDIARRMGDVALARAVGQALGANPVPLIIPCHRVLAAAGRTGGFSAPGGAGAKMRMLTLERAPDPRGQFSFGF